MSSLTPKKAQRDYLYPRPLNKKESQTKTAPNGSFCNFLMMELGSKDKGQKKDIRVGIQVEDKGRTGKRDGYCMMTLEPI